MSTTTKKKKYAGQRVITTKRADLPVRLTEKELLERSRELADLAPAISAEEKHAEAVKQGLKQRMGQLELKRSLLSEVVRSGEEPRPVEVHGVADFDRGMYHEERTDTGEVLHGSRRRLTDDEMQAPLPLGDEPHA